MSRIYTSIATPEARKQLDCLLESSDVPKSYQLAMQELGKLLAKAILPDFISQKSTDTIVVSTAEDADYLQHGVSAILKNHNVNTKLAVFWNHHYQLPSQTSVAPILHSFIEPNYEDIDNVIIVKSVMSGSCVVRTNLIEMLDKINKINKIYILSPVAHEKSEQKLKDAFPKEISSKFEFICFAIDDRKNKEGEVVPGIGGQIYNLLGLDNQPALTGYMPNVVKDLAFADLEYS